MAEVRTAAKINGKVVTTGAPIVSFRGEQFTFDYWMDGYVYVKERHNGFVARVFPDAPPEVKSVSPNYREGERR